MYNTVTGDIMITFINGSSVISFTGVLTLDPATWIIPDTADFNADGKTDLLIQNPVTGLTAILTMNGATIVSVAPVFEMDVAGGDTLVNAGHYNADEFTDLLILNTNTGNVVAVLLVNGAIQSQQGVANIDVLNNLTLHSGKP